MAVAVSLLSVVSTLLGGLIAIRARDRQHLVLGFAAGVMLGVVAFDLMPEAMTHASDEVFGVPVAMLAGAAGFLFVHILERSVAIHRGHESEYGHHAHGHAHNRAVGLLAGGGLVAHSLMDGLGIGVAFQAGTSLGVTVAVAVIAHDFADGFNTYTITTLYGNAKRRALALLAADAAAPAVGAALGSLLTLPAEAVGAYLGWFAGFLLYLATSDILPEAHADHDSFGTLLTTVGGMGFMWVVVGLAE